ncbi:hypothetical protein BC835DRAFT_1310074 [Cytidiella melzeri]|nr:hypothetical protein BC835DRAFT_1310074 [Cytidiella melzeri]
MSMHFSSVFKIPLLVVNAACMHIAYTPPNPLPTPAEMQQYGHTANPTLLFKLRRGVFMVGKGVHWLYALCESAVILAYAFPSKNSSFILHSLLLHPESAPDVRLTLPWLAGCVSIVAGVYIRFASQRELGPFFTFEQSVKKDQQLITTGPYAVVRHPAYTGMLLATIGTLLCQSGPGSWFPQSGWYEVPSLKIFAVVWLCYTAGLPCVMLLRTSSEDRVLRRHVPKEWDAYAKRTAYKMIPYVF